MLSYVHISYETILLAIFDRSKNKERKIDGANKAIRLDLFAATSG
jgi:hypothetical protein